MSAAIVKEQEQQGKELKHYPVASSIVDLGYKIELVW